AVPFSPGHDVVGAWMGADAGCRDSVVAAGAGKPRCGKFDGGRRHGEDVAVVDGMAVQGQPERIAELGGPRTDGEQSALSGGQMVLIPAGTARGGPCRKAECGRLAES